MLLKKKTTWVLVADGALARVYEQDASQHLVLLHEFSSAESHQHTHDLVSDRPGRSFDSQGTGGRHAMESRSDPQAVAKEAFVKFVAGRVNAAALEGKFDALILCAPPRVLGELRQFLDDHAQKLVKTELGKDLMKIPTDELPAHLAAATKD